jgi:hypothetical protein
MKKPAVIGLMVVLVGCMSALWSQDEVVQPRAPLVPRITSVDQLVPFAKIILQRDFIGQRLGWSIKGGERVLFKTSSSHHPWVTEAFIRALRELNCEIDVVIRDRPFAMLGFDGLGGKQVSNEEWAKQVIDMIEDRLSQDFNKKPNKSYGFGSAGGPLLGEPGIGLTEESAKYYDVIVGGGNPVGGLSGVHAWTTPELLASAGTVYPGEIMDLIDAKAWAIIRNAEWVEITDLQGSEASFTWHPEWWEIIEGTHPTIKVPGYESTFGSLRPGRSEYADFAGHIGGAPRYGAIEQTDFKGYLTGEIAQLGLVPMMTLWHDRGELTRIDGGNYYGDMWREALNLTRDIQYPGYPRPGTGWMMEFAFGTNPKIIGPMEIEELKGDPQRDPAKISWGFPRDRDGALHAGYGTLGASWWGMLMDMPVNHFHLHLMFTTYIVHTRDGQSVKLVDRGHFTVIDDPEVRALAAKYGDPDEVLKTDWVPGITEDGKLIAPKSRMVSYEEFIANMPFRIDDPRLTYEYSHPHLDALYGKERMQYYKPEQYLEFYRKLGQIPVKRVQVN